MSAGLQPNTDQPGTESVFCNVEGLSAVHLDLEVTDPDSVRELNLKHQGRARDEYALSALHIGVLSLKHAQGQIDVDAVRREGDRMLGELGQALASYKLQLNTTLTAVLKEYFDPNDGRFQERLERLIRKDGDLRFLRPSLCTVFPLPLAAKYPPVPDRSATWRHSPLGPCRLRLLATVCWLSKPCN